MFYQSPTKDLLIVLVIVLLIFGPKRLPALGKQLGQGLREFKNSITGSDKEDAEEHPQISQSSTAATPGSVTTVEQRPVEPARTEPRS
jgi:sec-independent protein translocase protein TatA